MALVARVDAFETRHSTSEYSKVECVLCNEACRSLRRPRAAPARAARQSCGQVGFALALHPCCEELTLRLWLGVVRAAFFLAAAHDAFAAQVPSAFCHDGALRLVAVAFVENDDPVVRHVQVVCARGVREQGCEGPTVAFGVQHR